MSDFLPEGLEKLLEDNGIPFKPLARSYVLTCPRCQKTKKLWVLKKNGHFVCWHCKETEGFKGRVEFALAEILGKSLEEIRSVIYEGGIPPGMTINVDLKDFDEDLIDLPIVVTLEEILWPPDARPAWENEVARGYLLSRGIGPSTAQMYDIWYWPSKRRVLFPVKVDGKLVGHQARAIDPNPQVKILTSTGLRREHVLMFQDRLKGADHAVLCEGPVDAIKADLCGGNVATMGKAVSPRQLEIILEHGIRRIYLALDPDAAEEVERLAKDLGGEVETYLLLPPPGAKDLGECSPQDVYEQFVKAKPFTSGNVLLHLKVPRYF